MAIDLGDLLDKTLDTYQAVSVARVQRDTAKYQNAGADQQQTLHPSEAVNAREAYSTGNAVNPAAATGGYLDRIPKPLLYGSMGLLGLALILRAR